jgi:hypothetical protein
MSGPADLKLKQKLAGVISKQLVEFDEFGKVSCTVNIRLPGYPVL